MNWRRVRDVLTNRAPEAEDERSIRAKQLAEHERTLARLTVEVQTATAESREMSRQSQTGSYGRVHVEPRK